MPSSPKARNIRRHYRKFIFECVLAGGADTPPVEAVVDANKTGTTITNFSIGVSPPPVLGALTKFRGTQRHAIQGVTIPTRTRVRIPLPPR